MKIKATFLALLAAVTLSAQPPFRGPVEIPLWPDGAPTDNAIPAENSIAYSRALIASKVPVAMFMYPTGGHGWGYRDDFKYKRQWTGELEKWLRERILK